MGATLNLLKVCSTCDVDVSVVHLDYNKNFQSNYKLVMPPASPKKNHSNKNEICQWPTMCGKWGSNVI